MPDDTFTTITSEGGLLPTDLLGRVTAGDDEIPGLTADDYHLGGGERLRERISRSWNRLSGVWASYEDSRAQLPEEDRGTTLTREKWLLPLFEELGYGRLQTTDSIDIEGTTYPVSHRWGPAPIHLVSFRYDLDRRAEGVAGAARWSPHAMAQELLNRTDEYLWAFVSNGRTLRVLRDSAALARQAYLEFDLEAMFDGQVYSDFVALWLTCHQSRIEAARPELCWLERWMHVAERAGTRALQDLRDGVEGALRALGDGFLSHPANRGLRDALAEDTITPQDYYRELLRVVYRLLFLFVAEDRDLLLDPDAGAHVRDRYREHYSTRRLRDLARAIPGSRHHDLWHTHQLVIHALGSDDGVDELALPPLGGQLFAADVTPHLVSAKLHNQDFLEAVRRLAWMEQDKIVRAVDYRNLGAEELGSVYESLLELHPSVSGDYRHFQLEIAPGSERKITGSYYTPSSLIHQLLDTALDPVIEQAASAQDPAEALLSLTVVDPACGSGHFLVAAAKRIARRLAAVRTGDGEPSPAAVKDAMREVVPRCIHGVDVNPMALELAKVSLWLEAHVPGKPLTFLDHHLRVGNSLLGATPGLVAGGIPDGAFKTIEGDDKIAVKEQRKRNLELRKQMETGTRQRTLLDLAAEEGRDYGAAITDRARHLQNLPDDTVDALHAKEEAHAEFEGSRELAVERRLADAWCAAFTAPKVKGHRGEEPFETFYRIRQEPETAMRPADEIEEQADEYQFFHWHLEFPHIFKPAPGQTAETDPTGWTGGFSAVIGNPPWEHTELKEKEFFATRHEGIASARRGSDRKKLIKALSEDEDPLYEQYRHAKRLADGLSHIARNSGRYPFCGTGRINTYALFAELNRQNTAKVGRAGFIVPTGIATDYTTRKFFGDLVETAAIDSLFDFENRGGLFPDIDSRIKFSLLTITGGIRVDVPEFAFFAHDVTDLDDPERRFTLSPEDIALINPNTKTAPVFRTRRDAEITAKIYNNVPVLVREGDPDGNPWGVEFTQGLFNMTSDSNLFRTREELEAEGWVRDGNVFVKGSERHLPLYEAKMIHHFDHRWATFEPEGSTRSVSVDEKLDPTFEPLPRYWVAEPEVEAALEEHGWDRDWLLGWRDITNSTNERTDITALFPCTAVGNSLPMIISNKNSRLLACLAANNAAFAHDYPTRQKTGGSHLNFFLFEQLPALTPARLTERIPFGANSAEEWISARALELAATTIRMADALGVGPFRFLSSRREILRAELDAAFFHLYGLERDEVDYIMGTFPIAKRKDIEQHGEYRTRAMILEIYDEMTKAIESGEPYQTRLDPPPADPSLQVDVDDASRT